MEKSMKYELMALFRKDLDEWMKTTSVSPGAPSADEAVYQECRVMSMCTFNFMAVKEGCYMGLHGEAVNGKEWAIRIMGNIITFGEKKEASLTLLKLLYPTEKDQQISKNDVNEILKELLN